VKLCRDATAGNFTVNDRLHQVECQSHATAYDDEVRVENVYCGRKAPGKHFRCSFGYFDRKRIPAPGGIGNHARVYAVGVTFGQCGQHCPSTPVHQGKRLSPPRRAGRLGFETTIIPAAAPGTILVHNDMSDLACQAMGPAHELSVDHDTPADSRADGDPQKTACILCCTKPDLGERARIDIVFHLNTDAK
jgi:hypothetical protein